MGIQPGRAAVIAGALVALILAIVVAARLLGGSGGSPAPATYSFPPETAPGLTASRTWTLTPDGLLQSSLMLTGTGGAGTTFDEVIPKVVATNASDVSFQPAPTSVVQPDPVVRYQFPALAAGATETMAYSVRVHVSQKPGDQLRTWAAAQLAAEAAYQASPGGASPTSGLAYLTVSPSALSLRVGQSQTVALSGSMADGSPAPASLLASPIWTASKPGVASGAGTKVTGLAAGSTRLTVAAGGGQAALDVTVFPAPSSAPSTTLSPTAAPKPSAPAPSSPGPSPSASPAPPFPTCAEAAPPAPPAPVSSTVGPPVVPLYQLCSPATGFRFYTDDPGERSNFLQAGYVYEQVAGQVWQSQGGVLIALYRLVDAQGRRFYTDSQSNRDSLVAGGMRLEGVAGYVGATQISGTVPLEQLSSDAYGAIYTVDGPTKSRLVAQGWRDDGPVAYVLPPP